MRWGTAVNRDRRRKVAIKTKEALVRSLNHQIASFPTGSMALSKRSQLDDLNQSVSRTEEVIANTEANLGKGTADLARTKKERHEQSLARAREMYV